MRKLTTLVLLAFFLASFAQKDPSWTRDFDAPVEWQRITSLGQLIAHSNGSLIGINTEDGSEMWKVDGLGRLNESSFEGLGKSNFFTISSTADGNQVMLFNSLTGKRLIDTKVQGITNILSSDLLPQLGMILMVIEKPGLSQASLIAFDMNSGATRWTNDELFKVDLSSVSFGGSKLGGLLKQAAQTASNEANKEGLLVPPIGLDDKSLLLLHPNFTYCVNPNNGEQIWSLPNEGGAVRASANTSSKAPGTVFIGVEKEQQSSGFSSSSSTANAGPSYMYELYSVNIATGKTNWSKPYLQRNANLSTLIFADNGVIVSPPSTGSKVAVNLVDYSSGTGKWGKKGRGNKVKGSIVSHQAFDGGWLVTLSYDNAWSNAGAEYYINVLTPDGLMRFDKNVKLKGDLKSSELLDNGLLYVTDKEINVLNLSTGDLTFESPEAAAPLDASKYSPLKHSLAYQSKGDKLYTFSSKSDQLYEIDKASASIKAIGPKIKFEGKETPYNLEMSDDGIVLSAEQNIMKIGYDGTTKYQVYYEAPREPGLMRALAAAQAMRAAYIGAAAAAYSEAFAQAGAQSDSELGQQIGNELSEGYGELSQQGFAYSKDAMAYATARFKASARTPDYMFILTDLGKKQYALVQVSKETGEKIDTINLGKDKEPSYELDEISGRVFYQKEPTKLVCYQF